MRKIHFFYSNKQMVPLCFQEEGDDDVDEEPEEEGEEGHTHDEF